MKVQRGAIIIADISGYTHFVKMHVISVLHAEGVLSELMKSIANEFKSPIKLVKLEGDAALFFAPFVEGKEAEIIKQATEQAIHSFRAFNALRDQHLCICQACLGLQSLTLKIVFHVGDVVEKSLLDVEELTGDDMVIAHRLLKNSVKSHQYFLMSDKYYHFAKNILPLKPESREEAVEGFGKIKVEVFDGKSILKDSAKV